MKNEKGQKENHSSLKTERSLEEYQQLFQQEVLPLQEEIYHLILSMIPHKQDAEDVFQKIFEKSWASLPRLRYSQNIRQWLYQIARRTIFDYFAHQSRNREILFSDWEDANKLEDSQLMINDEDIRDLLDQLLEEEDLRYFWNIFSQLDETTRSVIWLWYDNEWLLKQVAVELKLNYNSVRSIFTRGISKLRKLLQENNREDFHEQ